MGWNSHLYNVKQLILGDWWLIKYIFYYGKDDFQSLKSH